MKRYIIEQIKRHQAMGEKFFIGLFFSAMLICLILGAVTSYPLTTIEDVFKGTALAVGIVVLPLSAAAFFIGVFKWLFRK